MTELGLNRGEAGELRDERPHGIALVVAMLGFFGVLAAGYAVAIAAGLLAFNSGAWLVGDDTAMRGTIAYSFFAVLYIGAATALGWPKIPAELSESQVRSARLWQAWGYRAARALAILLIAYGLLPAVPGISAAVVDLRPSAIAFWGAVIVARSAGLYVLLGSRR